jgi:hypothetical protein
MNGDVTRQTFHSGRHYRSVRQQQGRVQLDADWNEQADIQAYLDRSVTADLVGISGAPRGYPGMAIVTAANEKPDDAADDELWIGEGHYYVDGILCENDERVLLTAQPDLPGVTLANEDDKTDYIAYLDVWFEQLTLLDESSLREVALGGPDTTTRARTIWQVRLRKGTESNPATAETFETRKSQMRARLVDSTSATPTPCVVGPDARYRRLENQLYRVEVFDPGKEPDKPTFLWSRENGSVIAALGAITAPTAATSALTLTAPGRDARLAFEKDYWVEVTDLARTRRGDRGLLAKIDNADGPALTVTWYFGDAQLTSDELAKKLEELGTQLAGLKNPVARRWDGTAGPQRLFPGPVEPDKLQDVLLEDTINVAFSPDGDYRRGDYWLIPARTANLQGNDPEHTGTIEWPGETLQPPEGVVHHFADIARLSKSGGKWTRTADERPIFDPLTGRLGLVMAGGDGQESLPKEWLDEPLRVAVTRTLLPKEGAKVRFTTVEDTGSLSATDPAPTSPGVPHTVDVDIDGVGIAQCWWKLVPDGPPSQQVTAQLVNSDGEPTEPALVFAASLSLASRVAFDPTGCAAFDGATTVQAALRTLAAAPVLVPVDGNGQVGAPNTDLATPVVVKVMGCGAAVAADAPAKVRFTVAEGEVEVPGSAAAKEVTGDTTADGTVSCRWRLGGDGPVQALKATLLDEKGVAVPAALPLTFLAGVEPKVLTPVRVELPTHTVLVDGAFVAAADLASGETAVVLDGEAAPVVADGPALTVTLDLPFPMSQSDKDLWSDKLVGSLPLGVDGTVANTRVGAVPATGGTPAVPGDPAVGWSPSADATTFLTGLPAKVSGVGRDKVRGHVRLAGSVLGPGVADFTRWFWLVQTVTALVIVPHSDGRLRLRSAQQVIALSVSRADLRAGLPAGVIVKDGTVDLAEATRLKRFLFNAANPPRHLQLVVDQRYSGAGAAVKAGLALVDVDMDLIDDADPEAKAKAMLQNNDFVDGVLTDAVIAADFENAGGFLNSVAL